MTFSPISCGPGGAEGDVLALGLLEAQTRKTVAPFTTEIGKIESVDTNGNPPTVTLTDGRTLRYVDDGSTYTVADKVLVILNGEAPYVHGHLTATPTDPASPTDDFFYTTATTGVGGTDADRPPLGFRFWQGTADSFGKGEVSTGFAPADVLIAVCTSPETLNGDNQWQRPVEIHADGVAKVSGMRPGRPYKIMIVGKDDTASSPGDYEYICTGQNQNLSDELGGKHPRLALAYKTGTLSSTGTRSNGNLPSGVNASWTVAVHARAIVDGVSIDLSRFSEDNYIDYTAPVVDADGSIDASHSSWRHVRNATYNMTWVHTPTTNLYTTTANDHKVTYWGADAIGEQPEFELRLLDFGQLNADADPPNWEDGRYRARTYIPNAREKVVAAFCTEKVTGGIETLGAEFHNVARDEWQISAPRLSGWLPTQNTNPWGLAVVLRGANTCQPVGKAGFTNPPSATSPVVSASVQEVNNFDTGTWTPFTLPTHTTGDLLVVAFGLRGQNEPLDRDIGMPAGWTKTVNYRGDGAKPYAPYLIVFTKIAASASETATPTISGTNQSHHKSYIACTIQNATLVSATDVNLYDEQTQAEFPAGPSGYSMYLHIIVDDEDEGLTTPGSDTIIQNTNAVPTNRNMLMSHNTSSAEITGYTIGDSEYTTVTIGVK